MRPKYYVTVNKEGKEPDPTKYDLITTRKAEYSKFAKEELKKGAESVDVYVAFIPEIDRVTDFSYITTFYPEDFNIK